MTHQHEQQPDADESRASEPISALIDGELDSRGSRFLIRRIAEDPGMSRRWQRFHLLRACMQREFAGPVSLVERVRSALDDEAAPSARPRSIGALMRAGAGGAVAAGVAVVAIVALGNRVDTGDADGAAGAEAPGFVSQTTALDRQFNPAAVPVGFDGARAAERTGSRASASQQRINRYMIRHSQAAGSSGFVALTPVLTAPSSVRVVRPTEDPVQSGDDFGEE